MDLAEQSLKPVQKGDAPLTPGQALILKVHLHPDWDLVDNGTRLIRRFRFRNFKQAMALAVIIGDLAESENHHPDLFITWGRLDVSLTTHDVQGLTENDVVFAAKVDKASDAVTP
ncbi:4a-hydroxytetrahydrobiopterin dehydratase [Desulfatiferula olefinivorans]